MSNSDNITKNKEPLKDHETSPLDTRAELPPSLTSYAENANLVTARRRLLENLTVENTRSEKEGQPKPSCGREDGETHCSAKGTPSLTMCQ